VAQFRASFDSASPRMNAFTYVYILQSENHPDRFYIGRTADLRNRITLHNAGRIRHTVKWKPWRLKSYIALSDTNRAIALEHYLKSSSGVLLQRSAYDHYRERNPFASSLRSRRKSGAKIVAVVPATAGRRRTFFILPRARGGLRLGKPNQLAI